MYIFNTFYTIRTSRHGLQPHKSPRRAVQVSPPRRPPLGVRVRAVRGLGNRKLPAVGPRQQGVETVVRAGVVSFVVDVSVVEAAAGERSLVHKHQAAVTRVISGRARCRRLGHVENTLLTAEAQYKGPLHIINP